jgi:hypothetical protein
MLSLFAAILSITVAASPAHAAGAPACKPKDLRLSLDGLDGDFNGMSHGGTALVIRNLGRDCILPALVPIDFLDARGRKLPVLARAGAGARPGQVHLAGGHRVEMTLRWVSGPVYPRNRSGHLAALLIEIGRVKLRAPLRADLYGESGKPIQVERSALRAKEGMAADR